MFLKKVFSGENSCKSCTFAILYLLIMYQIGASEGAERQMMINELINNK